MGPEGAEPEGRGFGRLLLTAQAHVQDLALALKNKDTMKNTGSPGRAALGEVQKNQLSTR